MKEGRKIFTSQVFHELDDVVDLRHFRRHRHLGVIVEAQKVRLLRAGTENLRSDDVVGDDVVVDDVEEDNVVGDDVEEMTWLLMMWRI